MQTPNVPNYLPQAILVTLFCCLPFGIVAIIYASQVNSHLAAGNHAAAASASEKAKLWCWVSFGLGLAVLVLYLLLFLLPLILGS
ncbi:CD225/dispanin family protein [Lyngbya confervoides]|uniref:CD225/dispanin family protein n=1 Tax=Lyngbya confervoides BDU141951 TaxID=1574623 RepID=A0ABD4TA73_9CYAN|nr:CD225/dispanin family protein [Lyngbya confervoides]MCM1985152.1 CD225/dispanin family protein [Lyngbya confervoides BDU141951]